MVGLVGDAIFDASLNEDHCLVPYTNALWILGMLRPLVISLYRHWRTRNSKPHHQLLAGFQAALGEDHLAMAMAFVTQQQPKL